MPVLLSSIDQCINDLGRVLFAGPQEWNVKVDVDKTCIVRNLLYSHTEYRLRIVAVPCNNLATETRYFYMWTRYRDVRHLWEQLTDVHKKLQLRGEFPQFVEPVMFGSNSAEVVAERTLSIMTFLDFVLAHRVLRQSKALHDYLEKATETKEVQDDTKPLVAKKVPIALEGSWTDGSGGEQTPGTSRASCADEAELITEQEANDAVPNAQHVENSVPTAAYTPSGDGTALISKQHQNGMSAEKAPLSETMLPQQCLTSNNQATDGIVPHSTQRHPWDHLLEPRYRSTVRDSPVISPGNCNPISNSPVIASGNCNPIPNPAVTASGNCNPVPASSSSFSYRCNPSSSSASGNHRSRLFPSILYELPEPIWSSSIPF